MTDPLILPFATFWDWLVTHPNCILRAGTLDAVLYDDDDLHWHFANEGRDTLLVQVLRGKRLLGELLLAPERVSFVQGSPGEQEGEYVFDLFADVEGARDSEYFFVLSHGYDAEEPSTPRRLIH